MSNEPKELEKVSTSVRRIELLMGKLVFKTQQNQICSQQDMLGRLHHLKCQQAIIIEENVYN